MYTTTFKFTLDVKGSLLKIFNGISLEISPPDVLHSIAQVEVHVLHNVNALHTRWMTVVMDWVIYWRVSFFSDWHTIG
jgi:hypothetical protein